MQALNLDPKEKVVFKWISQDDSDFGEVSQDLSEDNRSLRVGDVLETLQQRAKLIN